MYMNSKPTTMDELTMATHEHGQQCTPVDPDVRLLLLMSLVLLWMLGGGLVLVMVVLSNSITHFYT